MMIAEELRIGNWVHANSPNMQVKEIMQHGIVLQLPDSEADLFYYDFKDIQGIPLASDILEKCGFKYDDDKQWWYWNPELQTFEIRVLELPFSYGDWHISKGFMTWNDELRDVKYLHELQNAVYFGLGYEINYTP